jgi:4-amino-4-deoxy-L-arabinose transferase-like glycosyltransferase
VIALVALAGRVVYIVAVTQYDHGLYDATYYELQARTIAQGEGFFDDPFSLLDRSNPRHEPAADHPPMTVLSLLPAALIDDRHTSDIAMRLTMALLGTATVVCIGLLGRRLAGDTVGLVAAGIAALDPNLWMNDGLIMSETLSVLLTVGVMWSAYVIVTQGATWRRTAGIAALTGLGILTRAEFFLFIPFLVLPALWVGAQREWRRALGRAVGAGAVVVLVLAPWFVYNISRFENFTTLSTNDGLALRAANCDEAYYGWKVGSVQVFPPCTQPRDGREQSVWNAANRRDAISYMLHHLDRLPVVALARLGRTWNVYAVDQSIALVVLEGRPRWASWSSIVFTWCTIPLAIGGGVLLRRRRVAIWPLVVPIVSTTLAIALWAGGISRYRASAEPSLVILAAVALTALVRRRRATPAVHDQPDTSVSAPAPASAPAAVEAERA